MSGAEKVITIEELQRQFGLSAEDLADLTINAQDVTSTINITLQGPNGVSQSIIITPTADQDHSPNTSQAQVMPKSYIAGNDIIKVGRIPLRAVSPHLADIGADVVAELLVAPQNLASIDMGGFGTWVDSIARMRAIKNYHGLPGWQIFDRPYDAPNVPYEEALAQQLLAAFKTANQSGNAFTTGWFMPTLPILRGCNPGSDEIILPGNLFDQRDIINARGEAFIPQGSPSADWQSSSTETADGRSYVHIVGFRFGTVSWRHKGKDRGLSTRPVALSFQPR